MDYIDHVVNHMLNCPSCVFSTEPMFKLNKENSAMPKQTQRGSQHTPGPWHIGKHELQHRKTVYATDEWPVAEAISRNNRPDDEILANAYLIAAAPELLAVMKEAITEFNDKAGLSGDTCDKMNKAIAQAQRRGAQLK